jgi:hypothetical protein
MTMVMRRMKASPSGLIDSPVLGDTTPTTMAMATPIRTCPHRVR